MGYASLLKPLDRIQGGFTVHSSHSHNLHFAGIFTLSKKARISE